MKLRNNPVLWAAIGVVLTLVLAAGVVLALQRTGGANAVSNNAPLIAAVIALGGVFIAQVVSIALDARRTQESRELEAQRAHEAALQNYFEQVGSLLIEKPLRRARPSENLSTVVRAQTLAVLEGLDPDRKRILLQFLYESGLIYKDKPVVSLYRANLMNANLARTDLSRAWLSNADLSNADLSRAWLSNADLSNADLNGANLNNALLYNVDLKWARLQRTELSNAGLSNADLNGANLSKADLSNADLSSASLREADLSKATLEKVELEKADLSRANLAGAERVTEEQLERAASLKGATMPTGQLRIGEYVTDEFTPALSFEVTDAWQVLEEQEGGLTLLESPDGGKVVFLNPDPDLAYLYEQSSPRESLYVRRVEIERKEIPSLKSVDEWVAFFQSYPREISTHARSVSVGGASGKLTEDVISEQGLMNLPFHKAQIESKDEILERFFLMEVGDKTVVIDVAAPKEKFDSFLPKAQKMLDTVKWKNE